MSDHELLKDLLRAQLGMLASSVYNIQFSNRQISQIDLNNELSDEDFTYCDAFSSRFLRLYEVLFNQVIRTYLNLVRESENTTLDTMAKAEKLDLIVSAHDLDEIRKLRNKIAHEHLQHEWIEIYKDLKEWAVILQKCCEMTRAAIYARFPELNDK